MEKIFIVDAVNYLFRSYYAIGPMVNDKGQSTSALFGFIRSLEKLKKDFSPDYLAVVFDGPDSKRSRTAAYSEYKMHRKKAPDDLYAQFDLAIEYCNLAGIPTLSVEGVEADDTMASIAIWAEKEKIEVYLCTSDKDLFQLVKKGTYIVLAHKDNMIVDKKKVEELFGVTPEQMVDFLAITGDTSDNIPGLPGFGPKSASALLKEFKTLENILKNPEKVAGEKKQKTIKEEQDKAILSKELVLLNSSVAFPRKRSFFKQKKEDHEALLEFYKRMNFTKFQKELKGRKEKIRSEKGLSYNLINSKKEMDLLLKKLLKKKKVAIDTETTSKHPIKASLVGVGFSFEEKEAYYLPFNGNIEEKDLLSFLKELEKSSVEFIGHNIKYDINVLKNYGIDLKNISFDTILASYLLGPQHKRHNLDLLTLEYFDKVKTSYKELTTKNKKTVALKDVEIEKVSAYCCEDVDYTFRLEKLFSKKLAENKLDKLFFKVELPLIPILAKMERSGIYIDKKCFDKLLENFSSKLKTLEKAIYKKAGEKFNINSPKQLSHILFKKLAMPLPKRKKTEYSTGAEVLENLAKKYEIASLLLEHRTLQKLLTTYVVALPKQVMENSERIHPTFNQSVTATGRLSCQDPNLQNIPTKSKEIRACFKPQKKGWSYISFDYSQIELRLLAHFSQDPQLLSAFKKKQDIHAHTASLIFDVKIKDVTKKMRKIAKGVNFGILYGQGPFALSKILDIPFKRAREIIEIYFKRYKKIEGYLNKCTEKTSKDKYAETLFKRRRPILEIDNKNPTIRESARRLAINTPLQGTAADIIKIAMIEIDKEIEKRALLGFMVLQIHDELIFEVPDNEIDKFKKLVKEKMEGATRLTVDLTVDIRVGKNWGEC